MFPNEIWFPHTKLHPPRFPEGRLLRPRLSDELLAAVTTSRLTLLSAPAGSGKTTLLAALLETHPDLSVAWLGLDETDADPFRFLALLLAALQHRFPEFGSDTRAALQTLRNPAEDQARVLGVLINDLLARGDEPLALVLEDLHTIQEPLIFQALDYLLEHIPPYFHLVIAARHDPPLALARLRARGQMVEFRLPDLCFQPEESDALLNDHLRLGLSSSDLTALQGRTEGWAAGLRLLAVSLERIPSGAARSEFITHLAAGDRFVFDFLAEEVLDRQEAGLRAFLLETSILRELTPPLCQAVSGREDAANLLENLYRRGLFLSMVHSAQSGPVYRYHDLFAAFLGQQLGRQGAERLRELHRRAATAQTDPAEAIRHYLAAELWEEAGQRIVQAGRGMLASGGREQVRRWILALPEEERARHPWLTCLLGTIAYERGEYGEAQSLLEGALQAFAETGDPFGQAETLLQLSGMASGQHDPPHVIRLAEQALALPLSPRQQAQAHIVLAWAWVYSGDWEQVGRELEAATRIALDAADPAIYHILAQHLHIPLAFAPKGIATLTQYAQRILPYLGDGIGLARASTLNLLSGLHLLRGEVEAAEERLAQARAISKRLGGFVFLDLNIDFLFLGNAFAHGDYAAFDQYWQEHLARFEQLPGAREWLASYLYLRGRVSWLQGHLGEAQKIYDRMAAVERPQDIPENQVARLMMRAMLEISAKRYPQAESVLRQAIHLQGQAPYTRLMNGDARLLLAALYRRQNRLEDALGAVETLLAEYTRLEMPGLILMEAETVAPLLELAVRHGVHKSLAERLLGRLQALTGPRPVALPSGETLTPREAQVLRLIAQGASNGQIAGQLVITERTVKSHVTSILGKLGVKSRTQAAARARELHIV